MSRLFRNTMCALAFVALVATVGCNVFPTADTDQDGIADLVDNCPNASNANQADPDADGLGSVCDNCPNNSNADQVDQDGDTFGAACDVNDFQPLVH